MDSTDRFMRKVAFPAHFSGCWMWIGYRIKGGYGKVRVNKRDLLAHRVAYELAIGPIPAGLVLDHLCRVRACVNPLHLEPVTQQENVLRGVLVGNAPAARTHCPNDHEYTPENTHVGRNRSGGQHRRCKECNRDRHRARAIARKAA